MEERSITQSINLRSARTYNYIRDSLHFHLSSQFSLHAWANIKFLKPGIQPCLIENLKSKYAKMKDKEKEAVIVFDEIMIRKDLKYNSHEDEVQGFEDLGFVKTGKLAKQVCMFMIRGLYSKWKCIVGYFASSNSIRGKELERLLKLSLEAAFNAGFIVRATICDQGSNNRNLYKRLNVSINEPYFYYENRKINALYDTPNLIKSFRNVLMKSNLNTPDGVASWQVIRNMFDLDISNVARLCPKLTNKHIYPNNFQKMRVKLGTQVLSHTCN